MHYFVVAWCCCCLPALKSPAGIPDLCCLQTQRKIAILSANILQSTGINRWEKPDEAVQATKILSYLLDTLHITNITIAEDFWKHH